MRIFVFFDLPTITLENRREYRKFRKHLIKSGFLMLQESVYCKLALNSTAVNSICESLRNNKPPKGLIQILTITEKQFARSEYLVGDNTSEVINTDERLIIL